MSDEGRSCTVDDWCQVEVALIWMTGDMSREM